MAAFLDKEISAKRITRALLFLFLLILLITFFDYGKNVWRPKVYLFSQNYCRTTLSSDAWNEKCLCLGKLEEKDYELIIDLYFPHPIKGYVCKGIGLSYGKHVNPKEYITNRTDRLNCWRSGQCQLFY